MVRRKRQMDITKILITRDAKINFLKGLIRLAKADGIRDDNEVIFYHQAVNAMGLDAQDCDKIDLLWKKDSCKIDISFETNKEKMFFFIQAIQLCWIDGSYTEEEREEIYKIASELQISATAIQKVESWVDEGMAWNKRGNSLLELS